MVDFNDLYTTLAGFFVDIPNANMVKAISWWLLSGYLSESWKGWSILTSRNIINMKCQQTETRNGYGKLNTEPNIFFFPE